MKNLKKFVALLLAVAVKLLDKKKHYGLQLPNIQ